ILGADRCVAVNPSDTAPALIALDASMVVRSKSGERVVPAEEYFIGPGTDITRMTILQPGDLLTAIRIPGTWGGARFYFEKVPEIVKAGIPGPDGAGCIFWLGVTALGASAFSPMFRATSSGRYYSRGSGFSGRTPVLWCFPLIASPRPQKRMPWKSSTGICLL